MSSIGLRQRLGPFVPNGLLAAAVVGCALIGTPGTTEDAVANGDTRTIYLHHAHTKESISATYMVDGQYDSSVLEKLNWFLRDWRRDEPTHMDPRLFDVVWSVYRESGSAQPIEVMSAYRSPETNAMLRRRSRAVAEHSQHILGKAMDQHYVDVPVSRIRELAMKLQRGGVGFYPTAGSPFVHMDVGGVRHWPRMSYDQLVRLFPDGKTVHIPSNGQPLARYEEARAELEARGDSFAYPTATEVKSKGFFAWLFGGGDEDEDAAASSAAGSAPSPAGRGRGYRDQQPRQRMASLDQMSTGAVGGTGFGMQSKGAGMREFNAMAYAAPPAASSSYGTLPRRGTPSQPAPAPQAEAPQAAQEASEAQAQQRLAAAMAAQQAAAAAAAARAAEASASRSEAEPAPPAEASAPASTAPAAAAAPTTPAPVATIPPVASPIAVAAVPMPPRRPVELASDGPSAPLPPGRPTEFAALAPLKPGPRDAIQGLLAAAPPSRVPGLPVAITQGTSPAARASGTPAVLAYAAPTAPAPPPMPPAAPPRAAVPLPVARPSFVAARLDRSNFRALTAASPSAKAPPRSGVGSAVSGLRSAARASLDTFADQPSAGSAPGFSRTPAELATDGFSGSAVRPRDHVVTAAPAARSTASD